jgi:regulator of protease activity HflC (stomatin/prohibitin superfamily)
MQQCELGACLIAAKHCSRLASLGGRPTRSTSAQVYEEGTHIMIPWFERPIIYDVRARPNVIQSTSGSRDLQMVRQQAIVAGLQQIRTMLAHCV